MTATMTPVPAEIAGQPVHRFSDQPVVEYVAEMLEAHKCPGYLAYQRRGDRPHWRSCDNPLTVPAVKRGDQQCGQCSRDDLKARAQEGRDAAEHAATIAAIRPGIAELRGRHPAIDAAAPELAELIAELRALEPRNVPWSIKLQAFIRTLA